GEIVIQDVSGGSGSSYEYSHDGGSSWQTSNTFSDLTAGDYDIQIRDDLNCTSEISTVSIDEPPALSITDTASTDLSCNGDTDGSITLSAEGGTGTLTYKLQPDGTENNTGEFTNLNAGTYRVEITDENGCGTESNQFTLTEPEEITIDAGSIEVTRVSEPGAEDGSISLNASGGTAPLTYTLNPDTLMSNQTGTFEGLSTGSYLVTVTDVNQCSPATTDSLEIKANTAIDPLTKQYNVKLYPNPAKDNLQLEMSMDDESDVRLEFINVIGKTVEEQKFARIN
ncbi:MAG: hypothetical protein ACLFM7_05650, partial [Bacteroidales bacterium]